VRFAPPDPNLSLAAVPHYRDALTSGEFHVSRPYVGAQSKRWTCLLSHPVMSEGQRVGTLVLPLHLPELADMLLIPPNRIGLSNAILDTNGIILARQPDPESYIGRALPDFPRLKAALERGQRNDIEITGLDDQLRIVSAEYLPGTDWIMTSAVPAAAIHGAALTRFWITCGSVLAILAAAGVLVVRYARALGRPITELAAVARERAAGREGALARVDGPAEIADTARAFNEMIEARRRSEQAVAESEHRYRTVIDQTGQIVYDLDLRTGKIRWFGTEAITAITGRTLAEFQDIDLAQWERLVHPEDRPLAVALLDQARQAGQPYRATYRFQHRDGSYRPVEDHGVFLADESGHSIRMLGRLGDISERLRAQQSLAESELRYRTLIDQTGQMFYDLDIATGLVQWSGRSGIARLTGRTTEQLNQGGVDGWKEMLHPDDRAEAVGRLEHSLATGAPCRNEYRLRHVDGTYRLVEEQGIVLRGPDGTGGRMLGVMSDATERKRIEAERRRMEKQLLETQKLESLGLLAGGIAHDFNNLLTGVLGNAGLARLEAPAGWKGLESLEGIEKAALRAADLCKQMLAYSGKGRFVVQRIDLNELITDTLQLLQVSIGKKAALRLNLTAGLPAIQADASQIRQIVMNLVINAAEAIGERSGSITLATGSLHADAGYLAGLQLASELPAGDYVWLEVGDDGQGMDAATVARIFDPFFTTKFTGRGLGLAAVLGIVRGHRGAIRVYSEPGRGTTFKLLFPAVAGAPESLARRPIAAATWTGSGRVLVVDDEEAVRTVAVRLLEKLGFAVQTASDGEEALAIFQAEAAAYRLVLLDLTMPRLDGEETFRRLRQLRPEISVVLMSGFNKVDAINRFTGRGLAGFVQKPFEVDSLAQELRRVLEAPPSR
jgi:PAS domain S-box-containing protein